MKSKITPAKIGRIASILLVAFLISGSVVNADAQPTFTTDLSPLTATVFQNASLTFRPVVSGTQPIAYQWQTNSVNVPGATGTNLTVSSLGLVPGNSYTLDLVVSNADGTNVSSTVNLTVLSNPPAAAAIYQDSFSRVGSLNGTTPDVQDSGGAAWDAASTLNTSGTNLIYTTSGGQAYLPFSPQAGHIYVLSIGINGTDTTGSGNWQALGFANSAQTASGGFYNGASAWLLVRGDRGEVQTYQDNFGGQTAGLPVFNVSGPDLFSIILDTTTVNSNNNAGWTYTFAEDGVILASNVDVYGSDPATTFVGLGGNNGDTGFFTDFQLSDNQALACEPSISLQPVSVAVYTNNTATFTAAATGGNPPFYQWQSVIGNVTNNIAGATNLTLILNGVTPSQAGTYYMVVSNSCGVASSIGATLAVLANPPQKYVLYKDLFEETNTLLNGVSPTVDNLAGTWTADISLSPVQIETNAILIPPATGVDETAFLPFTPQWGHVYVFSMQLYPLAGGSAWMDAGFSPSAFVNDSLPDQNAGPWFLQRTDFSGTQEFSSGYASFASGEIGGNPNGYTTWKIILDTTTGNTNANTGWTATVLEGATNSFGTVIGSYVYSDGNPTIAYIGVGAQSGNGASGLVANVEITDSVIPISIALSGGNVVVNYEGTLLQSTNVFGPWTTNASTSPYTFVPTVPHMFFREQP